MPTKTGIGWWNQEIGCVYRQRPKDKSLWLNNHRQRCETPPQHLASLVKRLLCGRFASTGESDGGWAIGCGGAQLARDIYDGWSAGIGFEATGHPADAGAPGMINAHMPNLAAGTGLAAEEAIFDDEPGPDTRPDREECHRVRALPGAKAVFGERGGIGIVFKAYCDAIECIREDTCQRKSISPAGQCGSGPGFAAAGISGATDADTDADWLLGCLGEDGLAKGNEEVCELRSGCSSGRFCGGAEANIAIACDQGCGRFCSSKVDAKYRFHP
jgi:hypothetical protein